MPAWLPVRATSHLAATLPREAGWRGRQARLGMCNHFNMDPAIQQAYRRMTTK